MKFVVYKQQSVHWWPVKTVDAAVSGPGPEYDWVAKMVAREVDEPGDYFVTADITPSQACGWLIRVRSQGLIGEAVE